MTKKTKRLPPEPNQTRIEVDGFAERVRKFDIEYGLRLHPETAVGNGSVRYRRYRMVVELIDEPIEVLRDRIRNLWRKTSNSYNHDALERVASELDFKLESKERGVDAKTDW